MRKLRVPVALTFVLSACGNDGNDCNSTKSLPCVQAPNSMDVCPENICVDDDGKCPTGCIPASQKFYCIPDGTDAGVCPQPSVCIVAGDQCPAGCTPVG
jgi:hypothetical protein